MTKSIITAKLGLTLLVVLVLISLPRFNRNDFLLGDVVGSGMPNDSSQYVAMAEIYAGKDTVLKPHAPFTYRPLVPFLASLLPLPAMTAINVLNLLALWGCTIMLAGLLGKYNLSTRQIMVLLLSFLISFPVFYYGAIGIVDPVVVAGLGMGCFLIQRGRGLSLLLLIFAGTFVKESIVLLIPVYFVYCLARRERIVRSLVVTLAITGVYLLGMKLARSISLDPESVFWTPNWYRFIDNVSRFRTWASLILSLGILGIAAMLAVIVPLIQKRWAVLLQMLPWLTGLAGAVALFVASILTAYSDGRFIWPALVFSLPIVGIFLREYQEKYVFLKLGGSNDRVQRALRDAA